MAAIKCVFLFNSLRRRCSLLPTAQWLTYASTAAWPPLRCWKFSSTSLRSKTAQMILLSTSFMQAEVSQEDSTSKDFKEINGTVRIWQHIKEKIQICAFCVDVSERVKLKRSDYPLVLRVMQGPCEQVCKIFLMEEDLGEEVTYDVMQHIPLTTSVLLSVVLS